MAGASVMVAMSMATAPIFGPWRLSTAAECHAGVSIHVPPTEIFLAGEVSAVGGDQQIQSRSGGHPVALALCENKPGDKCHVGESHDLYGSRVVAEAEDRCV